MLLPRTALSVSRAARVSILIRSSKFHPPSRVYLTKSHTALPSSSFPKFQHSRNWPSLASRPRLFPLGLMAASQREHGGHSHGNEDSILLTSTDKSDAGVRITRLGLYINLGMAVAKGVGGYAFNSKALTADAIHSLTDLVSDVMTLATVSLAMKPPSERFPGGYGKVESLGSLGVSGMLLAGGFLMGWGGLMALCSQFIPGFAELADTLGLIGHSHGHSHGADMGPSLHAAWLAAGSILIKEWLYRATLKVAIERKSSVLASNAYHHRVDSLTAFVALLMIGGANVFENASWMDPVGGLVISLMVIQAGVGNTKSAILELCDVGIDDDMKKKIRRAVNGALTTMNTEAIELRQVQGVKAGQTYLVDVELGVPGSLTVEETRNMEELVRETVGAKVRGVKRVKVRFVPRGVGAPDFTDEFIGPDVSPRSSPEPESEDEHDHDHSHKK